ncbi:MAG: winged helix-turn-helix domain-containing protein [Candidatus Nezhaarchaeota archaeon]|nr:winged helix-turn-helix domain-containing protein [Candidatus Nezhaarchaeota archaeon]MCX8141247.1 winged helix-turn-helix domain-containing protein [Candidatus Nezhaarchaeota archaeon]MDW8049513.1 winged helix-turn-helix domain-containing protein [Nitrososphaerota archaeon]
MRKRSRLDIVFEILEAIHDEGELGPTKLSIMINLSYDRVKKILDDMLKKKLIEVSPNQRQGSTAFRLTSRGLTLLSELRRVRKLLEDYGLV